jgi:hypothetical protein
VIAKQHIHSNLIHSAHEHAPIIGECEGSAVALIAPPNVVQFAALRIK